MASSAPQYRTAEPEPDDQRRAERHRVKVTRATARRLASDPVDASVYDVSTHGCRVAINGVFRPGTRLWLRFHGCLPIGATVAWCEGGFVGCRFDLPIERALLRSLTLSPA